MGMSEARNLLKVWAALLMAALALVLLAGVLLAKPAHAKAFTVNSTNHPGSGVCDATECTLEEAINEANDNGVSDTIGFASGLGGRGIVLAAATGGFFIENDTPDEAMDVRIVGPGGRGVGHRRQRPAGLCDSGGHVADIRGGERRHRRAHDQERQSLRNS
jgi:hypothetical protein